jgi:hypothetical protein
MSAKGEGKQPIKNIFRRIMEGITKSVSTSREQPTESGVAVLQSGMEGNDDILYDYCLTNNLSVDFIKGLGVSKRKYDGKVSLRIPYYNGDGKEDATLYYSDVGGGNTRWPKGSKIIPYGLWKLDEVLHRCTVEQGVTPHIFLVGGEINTHILWSYGLPALGIPGANAWKSEWSEYLEGLTVYVWQETGTQGEALVRSIGDDLPDILVISATEDRRDIAECHLNGDDVPGMMERLKNQARPYSKIKGESLARDATAAYNKAENLLHSDILGKLEELLPRLGLIGEEKNTKILYLALVSRLLEKPVSIVVKGPSSAGKSHTVDTVLRVFPESAYYELSSMSERALAYSEESLHHRMLVIHEAAGLSSEFGSYLLRTLLSEGCLRYETVEKTQDGLRSRLIEREGPTGVLITTTWASLHPENETRMLSLTAKDDPVQTQDILMTLAQRVNGREPSEPDLAPWHALQEWLELAGNREVTIPFAHELAEHTSGAALRMRRDFGTVLNLVCIHAILYQCQRDLDEFGRIVATLDDYQSIYDLVDDLISEGVEATVSPTLRETVDAVTDLLKLDGVDTINLSQIEAQLRLDKSAVSRRVQVAIEKGYLENLEDRRGKPSKLVLGRPLPKEDPVLPSPRELKKYIFIPPNNSAILQH